MSASIKPSIGLPPSELKEFPLAILDANKSIVRSHRAERSPWWFSAAPDSEQIGGRFDLITPNGTCYVADTVEVATRERLRETVLAARIVSSDFADSFSVSTFTVPKAYNCANIDSTQAANFGVTRELAALPPAYYPISRAWASAFSESAFKGIRYGARFSPGAESAWALFGKAGDDDSHYTPKTETISGRVACQRVGVAVAPHPRLSNLTILGGV